MRALLPLVLLALAAPAALAQEHEHGAGDGYAVVLHDGPEDGRAVVGALTHFGFALLDHDGKPVVHRNANFTIVQNGAVVFSTEDTHEYDGLFSFDHTFTRPGPFVVLARSEEMASVAFEGEAILRDLLVTEVRFEPDGRGPASGGFGGRLSVVDGEGNVVPHTDLLAELRRAGDERLASRFHLHIHDEPAAFTQAAPPGEYVLRVVGYQAFATGRAADVRPAVADFPVTVGPVPLAAAPPVPSAVPGVLKQSMGSASANGFTLHATVDPQNQVGVGQPVRIAGTIVNETGLPEAHVDFAFTLKGPRGLVFASESLHEYDGVFEHLAVPDVPGVYEATLVAKLDGASITLPFQIQVVPPAAPIAGAGVGIVTVTGLDGVQAGVPAELAFRVAGPQGAVQHSEVDVTISHEGEAPLYRFKLHTHGSGDTRATVILPHEGEWTVRVDPIPTLPQAVVFQSPAGPSAPIAFGFTVAGTWVDAPIDLAQAPTNATPGLTLVALLAVAAVVAMLTRRE